MAEDFDISVIVNNLPIEEKKRIFSASEQSWIHNLNNRFDSIVVPTEDYMTLVSEALFRFKKLYQYYIELYDQYTPLTRDPIIEHCRTILEGVKEKLTLPTRTRERQGLIFKNFVQRVSYLSTSCQMSRVDHANSREYLSWLLQFPIEIPREFTGIAYSTIFPNNFPHIYMRRVSERLSKMIRTNREHDHILKAYTTLTTEMAHRKQ